MRARQDLRRHDASADADACAALGVDWLGVNFVPARRACIDVGDGARRSRAPCAGASSWWASSPTSTRRERALRARGRARSRCSSTASEPPELVRARSRRTRTRRCGSARRPTSRAAARYAGPAPRRREGRRARSAAPGGPFDLALVAPLARARDVILAGGPHARRTWRTRCARSRPGAWTSRAAWSARPG